MFCKRPGAEFIENQSATPLRSIENVKSKIFCALCRKNGEPVEVYKSHCVKSPDGKVTCPILRKHICDLCGATGDYAHTRSHCPKFVVRDEIAGPRPKYRILSNGKSTKIFHHK
jgi:hypothetical protein